MDQKIYLIRHGETEWTLAGKHTGVTDLSLTPHGRQQAKWLEKRLSKHVFNKVFCSPLKRAKETCELTGLFDHAEIDKDLMEWNYGVYEGKTTEEIHKTNPAWNIFMNGGPNGESPQDIENRTQRIIAKVRAVQGKVVLFSSGHFLRALATCWIGYSVSEGKSFLLSTASLSILGYERETPVIVTWNQTQP